MTNAEWLNELVPEVSQGIKDAIMTARNVNSAAVYNGSKEVELAQADLYIQLTLMPDFSEGQLSVKYSQSSLKETANKIYLKHGDARYDSGEPLIKRVKL